MRHDPDLEELWRTAPETTEWFDPARVAGLPEAARRYLRHALAPGAPLAMTVRLTMHGTIKLGTTWRPFDAEQVLRWDRGFVWSARARVSGLPVSGFDRLLDGEGAMRWRLLGLFPVLKADGAEIARAAAGRMHAEAMWMPAVFLGPDVRWTEAGSTPHASIRAHGEPSELDVEVDASGAVRGVSLPRWGAPNTGAFGYHPFGGTADDERTVDGITIPTRHRVGWHYGTERFEPEGEFFRCTLDEIQFR
jgi:hypothetical protein